MDRMHRAHKPSEVDRLHQKAAEKTHVKDMGISPDGDPMNNMPGVNLPDKSMAARPEGSGDGFGKMMRGMRQVRGDVFPKPDRPAPGKKASGMP